MGRVAIATYTDPRATALSRERELAIKEKHLKLRANLERWGYQVLDINQELGLYNSFEKGEKFGISSKDESLKAGEIASSHDVSAFIAGLWHWTESNLVTATLRTLGDRPVMLYTDGDPSWAGSTCVTSVGASLWQTDVTERLRRGKPSHYRLIGDAGDELELRRWVKAMDAVHQLRRSVILVFGAPYTLGMEHLYEDLGALKAIVEDIILLDQYLIVRRAEELLREGSRVDRFIERLEELTEVRYDGRMLTPESLRRSVALYLGFKDIISEYLRDGVNLRAVSIKCQPELSEVYGVTACMIPAFGPVPYDLEGEKPALATTCEGDLKGTLSSLILELLSGYPALFGDVKYISDEYLLLANCGASALFYASLSRSLEDNLRATILQPQCQGASGSALTYRTPPAEFTVMRIFKLKDKLLLQYMITESMEFSEELQEKLRWGLQWPHTAFRNPLPRNLMVNILGANHLSGVPGDYRRELSYLASELGIELLSLNDESEVRGKLREIGLYF